MDRVLGRISEEAGYQTGYIGKWHLEGWASRALCHPSGALALTISLALIGDMITALRSTTMTRDKPTIQRDEPDYQTDQFMDFIDSAYKRMRHSVRYLSYGPPHFPMDMPDHLRVSTG